MPAAVGVLVGDPPELPECVALKNKLLERVNALKLPANFLDHLMDALGGPTQVAEMTGRRGRIVRDARRRTVFELRAVDASGELDSLNGEGRHWVLVNLLHLLTFVNLLKLL
jgi:hypothetical protein